MRRQVCNKLFAWNQCVIGEILIILKYHYSYIFEIPRNDFLPLLIRLCPYELPHNLRCIWVLTHSSACIICVASFHLTLFLRFPNQNDCFLAFPLWKLTNAESNRWTWQLLFSLKGWFDLRNICCSGCYCIELFWSFLCINRDYFLTLFQSIIFVKLGVNIGIEAIKEINLWVQNVYRSRMLEERGHRTWGGVEVLTDQHTPCQAVKGTSYPSCYSWW